MGRIYPQSQKRLTAKDGKEMKKVNNYFAGFARNLAPFAVKYSAV